MVDGSSITVGNIRQAVGVAIGPEASVSVNITRGLDELPTRYDGRVRNFLEYYLGIPEQPAPFGGRAADLAMLNTWLATKNAPHYTFLVAPAGRGKSALLAHWVQQLNLKPSTAPNDLNIVYFPISIRFNTNLETVVFASLAARMAHLYGEKIPQAFDAQQYRGVFSDYLRRTPPNGGPLLVVIDGLDETAGWEVGADIFPIIPAQHLKVIVAARPLAGDSGIAAWLSRLGWDTAGLTQSLSLTGLDRESISDVLKQMGTPLDALSAKIDIVEKLYQLSEGDPLLVRLYVEALVPYGSQTATFTPEDLISLKPGLDAYFQRWFEEQHKLWGAAKPIQDKAVRGLFNLCATALGPLKKADILALAPDMLEDSLLLDEAARAVNRLIIGDGVNNGYVFSHPRLGEYFAERLSEYEYRAWQDRFLNYGRKTLAALEAKALPPGEAPAYIVQYYGAHLIQTCGPASDFYALVCESWLLAWEWIEGTPAGFLNDVHRAWQQAEAVGPTALSEQIRSALCFASVVSISENVPNDLLLSCVEAEIISPTLGLVMARQKPNLRDRAECLVGIAGFLPSSEFQSIMSEALAAIRAIQHEGIRVQTLNVLAERLPENLLSEALTITHTIKSESDRAEALIILAERLPQYLLPEALVAARAIRNEFDRVLVLSALVKRLPEVERPTLLIEALTAARTIQDKYYFVIALSVLSEWLQEHERAIVLTEALATARAIQVTDDRAIALSIVAEQLSEKDERAVLREALIDARAIPSKEDRTRALNAIVKRLPEDERGIVFTEILATVSEIEYDYIRIDIFGDIVEHLPENLLDRALIIARTFGGEYSQYYLIQALIVVSKRLPKHKQFVVLSEALTTAHTFGNEFGRAECLGAMAEWLPESLVDESLHVARAIQNRSARAEALTALAMRLSADDRLTVLREALFTIHVVEDEYSRSIVLSALAVRLPNSERVKVLKEALIAVRTIPEDSTRVAALRRLVEVLPDDLLDEALEIARTIQDGPERVTALGILATRLSDQEQATLLLYEAWSTARTIQDEIHRARTLVALSEKLPERERANILTEALTTARRIRNRYFCALVLTELAKHMTEHEREVILKEALIIAYGIGDSCGYVLSEMAEWLPENLLSEAFAVANTIQDELHHASAWSKLVKRLPDSQMDEVLRSVCVIKREDARALALSTLVERLPKELVEEALALAQTIRDEDARVRALSAVAEQLPEDERVIVLQEVLTLANTLVNKPLGELTLSVLAKKLPEKMLNEMLMLTKSIQHEEARTYVLIALVERLPDNLLGEALQISRSLCAQWRITEVLPHLATRWSVVCQVTEQSEFNELSTTLRTFSGAGRKQLLGVIEALLPIIESVSGQAAVRETASAIIETAKWWP